MKKPARPAKAKKPAKPARPAHHAAKAPAKAPAKVSAHTRRVRHRAALKAAHTRTVNAKRAKKRGLALGDAVACCAAEALAAALRLAGWRVTDQDVLALYFYTASGPDDGATIGATLEAAAEFGLAGAQPRWLPVAQPVLAGGLVGADHRAVPGEREAAFGTAEDARNVVTGKHPAQASFAWPVGAHLGPAAAHALILGVDLPGPHAVLATPDGWWSWGEPYDPATWPDAVIEEAWAVTW